MAKAQAAMEFLMTYGWVIMLVLVVIGVLNYFGVFGIQGLVPEKCELGPGLECIDYHVGEGEATIVVQNTLGREITINELSFFREGELDTVCSSLSSDTVAAGATATLTCTGSFASRGKETFIPKIGFVMSGEKFVIEGEIYAAPKKEEATKTSLSEKVPQEPPAEACDNQADDDDDGLVDCEDTDCSDDPLCAPPADAPPPAEICDNMMDDDGDGLVDCKDADCSGDSACPAEPICTPSSDAENPYTTCSDGADNDCDSFVDCKDSDCAFETGASCGDGVDNDGDGATDCADPGCAYLIKCGGSGYTDFVPACPTEPACTPSGSAEDPYSMCSDGIDNDCDGMIDCSDSDCAFETGLACEDSADNDGDGLIDCKDDGCSYRIACGGPGYTDFVPACPTPADAPPPAEICDNQADDDGDGFVDCKDTDCSNDIACASCIDSDAGDKPLEGGKVTYNGGTYTVYDECSTVYPDILTEYLCDKMGDLTKITHDCAKEFGLACIDPDESGSIPGYCGSKSK